MSNIDASADSVEELEPLVAHIRQRWPLVKIQLRGDAGFCREKLMAWCESEGIDYIFGLAQNERLKKQIAAELAQAQQQYLQTQAPARVFTEFWYATQDTWSRERRVIAKAEYLDKLRKRDVVQAWAGSFDRILHKDYRQCQRQIGGELQYLWQRLPGAFRIDQSEASGLAGGCAAMRKELRDAGHTAVPQLSRISTERSGLRRVVACGGGQWPDRAARGFHGRRADPASAHAGTAGRSFAAGPSGQEPAFEPVDSAQLVAGAAGTADQAAGGCRAAVF